MTIIYNTFDEVSGDEYGAISNSSNISNLSTTYDLPGYEGYRGSTLLDVYGSSNHEPAMSSLSTQASRIISSLTSRSTKEFMSKLETLQNLLHSSAETDAFLPEALAQPKGLRGANSIQAFTTSKHEDIPPISATELRKVIDSLSSSLYEELPRHVDDSMVKSATPHQNFHSVLHHKSNISPLEQTVTTSTTASTPAPLAHQEAMKNPKNGNDGEGATLHANSATITVTNIKGETLAEHSNAVSPTTEVSYSTKPIEFKSSTSVAELQEPDFEYENDIYDIWTPSAHDGVLEQPEDYNQAAENPDENVSTTTTHETSTLTNVATATSSAKLTGTVLDTSISEKKDQSQIAYQQVTSSETESTTTSTTDNTDIFGKIGLYFGGWIRR